MNEEMWNDLYSTNEYVYGKEANDFLKAKYSFIPKGKVLLLAEGEGRNAVFLAKKGYEVTAVDISKVGLKKAEKLAKENNVKIETICEDLAKYDLGNNKWDGVVSIFCHLPLKLRQDLFSRIENALKQNGIFFLEAYRPEQLKYKTGGPPNTDLMISREALEKELPNLKFGHLIETDREVIEGRKHLGMAAVVQAIGTPK